MSRPFNVHGSWRPVKSTSSPSSRSHPPPSTPDQQQDRHMSLSSIFIRHFLFCKSLVFGLLHISPVSQLLGMRGERRRKGDDHHAMGGASLLTASEVEKKGLLDLQIRLHIQTYPRYGMYRQQETVTPSRPFEREKEDRYGRDGWTRDGVDQTASNLPPAFPSF